MNGTVDFGTFQLTGVALTVALLVGGVFFVIMLIAYTNVISRAGYSRWWILIMLVPLVNVIMVLIFCFKEWPMTRELRQLRQQSGRNPGFGGSGGSPTSGGDYYQHNNPSSYGPGGTSGTGYDQPPRQQGGW